MSMKNSIDTIEDQTRDFPACSAVPQPTVPRRAPKEYAKADFKTVTGRDLPVFTIQGKSNYE
jgi:hypothetical protein